MISHIHSNNHACRHAPTICFPSPSINENNFPLTNPLYIVSDSLILYSHQPNHNANSFHIPTTNISRN